MPRYRVVVLATGMVIPPENTSGFFTTRFVHASSPQIAQTDALRLVREAVVSEPAFASSPEPTLSVAIVTRVWSPMKRSKPNSGYSFFGPDGGQDDARQIELAAGAGWW